MIVIADTSPLNYLIQLQQDTLLPTLYGSVAVPPSVVRELSDLRAPQDVRAWIGAPPSWLEVLAVRGPVEPELFHLDEGERDAIQLAVERHADLLLMDEIEGRSEAAKRKLRTTGILGILRNAHSLTLIDAEKVLAQLLSQTNFRLSVELRKAFLAALRA